MRRRPKRKLSVPMPRAGAGGFPESRARGTTLKGIGAYRRRTIHRHTKNSQRALAGSAHREDPRAAGEESGA